MTNTYGAFSQITVAECVVTKSYYPDDQESVSKKYMEYDVIILQTKTILPHLRQLNMMGGYADGDDFVLRETTGLTDKDNDPTWVNTTDSTKLNGDRVLVGFVSGNQDVPVIFGVLPHPATEYGGKRENGRRRFSTHMGTSWEVDKDGNYTLKSKNTKLTVNVKDKITTISNGADGADDATLVVDGNNKKVTVKSTGSVVTELGDATDFMLLGTTYRNAESQLNQQLLAQLQSLFGFVNGAGAALSAASGPIAIPIVGGGLAAPSFALAGSQLIAAAQLINQMATAINQFEANAQTYLSQKNKLD